jgi:hypothetical protein
VIAGNSEHPTADVNAARPEVGPHRAPAASADVERTTEVTVTVMTPVTGMPVAMATVHAVSTMAMTMSATVAAMTTSRSGGNGSSGQSERGDSCERDFAKHYFVVSSC